jgi:hypothetical protein
MNDPRRGGGFRVEHVTQDAKPTMSETFRRGSDLDRIRPDERCEWLVAVPDDMVTCDGFPEAVWFIGERRVVTCHAHDFDLRRRSGSAACVHPTASVLCRITNGAVVGTCETCGAAVTKRYESEAAWRLAATWVYPRGSGNGGEG